MEHLRMGSIDMTKENVQKIAALFPNCVTEHKDEKGNNVLGIDFEKLKIELGDDIIGENEERYQFTWPDKKKAIREANTATTSTLRPCPEESVDFENTKNLYIEGDNLEVLKCLRETYLGKVKMIYIDPPYNTGNDFVYNDDFSSEASDYIENSGQKDSEGNRLFRNTESNGRFHTDWLNMMYPRLKVAKDLLSDDGVIFISIDDREVDNVRKICDEVFGYSNRLDRGSLIWVNRGSSKGFNKIVKNHEFIIAYGKKSELVKSAYGENNYGSLDELEHYCFNKPSPKNPFNNLTFKKGCKIEGIKNVSFTNYVGSDVKLEIVSGSMIFIDGILQNDVTLRGTWPYKSQIESYFTNKEKGLPTYDNKGQEWVEIYFNKNGMPRYRKQRNNNIISSVIDEKFIPNYGSADIANLFGKKEIFNFPKPVELLNYLIDFFVSNNAIIMDFYSGSATTAHAIMKQNIKTSGNRKFIMVQLPEETQKDSEAYKAGYKNICEIGKERIRRAGKKIKEESPLTSGDLDIGFRVLKLDSSNMNDVYYTPSNTNVSLFSQENIKEDRNDLDLLFQVMLESNVELSEKIETKKIEGKNVFFVKDNYLVACFDEKVTEKVITTIAKEKPYYFVLRDSSLASDNVADNFEQIFRTYSPDTIRKIL